MSDSRDDIDIEISRGEDVIAQDAEYNWYPSAIVTIDGSEEGETNLHVYMEEQMREDVSNQSGMTDSGFTLQIWRLPLEGADG